MLTLDFSLLEVGFGNLGLCICCRVGIIYGFCPFGVFGFGFCVLDFDLIVPVGGLLRGGFRVSFWCLTSDFLSWCFWVLAFGYYFTGLVGSMFGLLIWVMGLPEF